MRFFVCVEHAIWHSTMLNRAKTTNHFPFHKLIVYFIILLDCKVNYMSVCSGWCRPYNLSTCNAVLGKCFYVTIFVGFQAFLLKNYLFCTLKLKKLKMWLFGCWYNSQKNCWNTKCRPISLSITKSDAILCSHRGFFYKLIIW